MNDQLPPTVSDPVVEAYMVDVDRTLLRENLKLSVEDRIRQLQQFQKFVVELQRAGRQAQTQRADGRTDRGCSETEAAYPKVNFHV
jgi:FAD synthase